MFVDRRCLGSEFLPYLKVTVDKLFLAMSQDVTVPTNHNESNDDQDGFDDEDDEDDDVEMIETGDGWVTVRTSLVEEQASAVQMVLLLAEKLQEHYYPYVEQTVRLLTNLVGANCLSGAVRAMRCLSSVRRDGVLTKSTTRVS